MTAATVVTQPTPPTRVALRRLWWAGPLALGAALAANAVVRAVALAMLPVPAEFFPLQRLDFIALTSAGMLAAVAAYALIGRWAKDPARSYRRVAGMALLASFVPDLSLL